MDTMDRKFVVNKIFFFFFKKLRPIIMKRFFFQQQQQKNNVTMWLLLEFEVDFEQIINFDLSNIVYNVLVVEQRRFDRGVFDRFA